MTKLVRQFRQILLWPLQLMPIREDEQIQEPWELLERGEGHPWREVLDEFDCAPDQFQARHYSEFVAFLPYVRRFLYGEGRGRGGSPGADSPIRVFRRKDVARVRMTFPGPDPSPLVLDIAHVDLYFFYDLDIAILAVEVFGEDLPLERVEDVMFRFGRTYPTYWADEGRGGHCLLRAEWLDAEGAVLSTSDYDEQEQYLSFVGAHRAPRFADHWIFLLRPLVQHHAGEPGAVRYRQIEYSRMPLCAYLAMDDARSLTRADFIRLGLVAHPGESSVLPYSKRYVRDFEDRYCYDQYWNEDTDGRPGTRYMTSGHAFSMVGDASDAFFVDRENGLLGQFRHQYFLLFLIPHMHKATLLMLSDRMVDALNKLVIQDAESVRRFKRKIRQILEIFLRFTHRYWFHEVSDQPQAKELYRMTAGFLGNDALFSEIHDEVWDMSAYLEGDTLRRQANTVVRLTVVTAFGLIGTVATGFLGMNLFALSEVSTAEKVAWFVAVIVPVTALTFYTILKSKRLSDFLEALSDERLPARAKLGSLAVVWRKPWKTRV